MSTPCNNENAQPTGSFVRLLTGVLANSPTVDEHAPRSGERTNASTARKPTAKGKAKRKLCAARKPKAPKARSRKRDLSTLLEDATREDTPAAERMLGDDLTLPDILPEDNTASSKKPRNQTSRKQYELLSRLYVDKLVAFSPVKETWLKNSIYADAGSAYIVGRVTRFDKKKALLEVQWIDTQFQKSDEYVGVNVVQRGIENYSNIMNSPTKPAWRTLCRADLSEIEVEEDVSDIEEVEESKRRQTYNPEVVFPSTMADVESIENMKFDPVAQIPGPSDLYEHSDGTTHTRILPEYRHIFEHSASSAFFAYIPVYFWVEVLHQTNKAMREYERANRITQQPLFTLQELMTFLGILFYMTLVDKGEYANYWGQQVEDRILGAALCLWQDSNCRENRFVFGQFQELDLPQPLRHHRSTPCTYLPTLIKAPNMSA
ncbi:hypothetical protein PR001_g14828 [Phytophthora rubi]|nr:hypothetical protein PR002_g15285 [Phytophthora rubi]KAE9015720.1 hypothetical protein PR001_g14828 [Phytophthora rubi]